MVRQVTLSDLLGLKSMIDAEGSSNTIWISSEAVKGLDAAHVGSKLATLAFEIDAATSAQFNATQACFPGALETLTFRFLCLKLGLLLGAS